MADTRSARPVNRRTLASKSSGDTPETPTTPTTPLTVDELLAALRLGGSQEETAQVERLLAYATEVVERHAPDAPDAIKREAIVRLSGYAFDRPEAPTGAGFANELRNSGAASILLPYRVHRAGLV